MTAAYFYNPGSRGSGECELLPRRTRLSRMRVSILLASLLCLAPRAAAAIEVESVRWGVGGRLVPGGFQLVTVQIGNPGDTPAEGILSLEIEGARESYRGAKLERAVYLSPGAKRVIQFHPLVGSTNESWVLRWNGERAVPTVAPILQDSQITLVIVPPLELGTISGSALTCWEASFPETAVVLDGVREIHLYRDPSWNDAQRQALRDWTAAGGVVSVIHRHDEAPAALSNLFPELEPLGKTGVIVGAGEVRPLSANAWRAFCEAERRGDEPRIRNGAAPHLALAWAAIGAELVRKYRARAVSVSGGGSLIVAALYVAAMSFAWLRLVRRDRRPGRFIAAAGIGSSSCVLCLFLVRATVDAPAEPLCSAVYARVFDAPDRSRLDLVAWNFLYVGAGGSVDFDVAGRSGYGSVSNRVEPLDTWVGTGATAKVRVTVPPFSFGEFIWREVVDSEPFFEGRPGTDPEGWPILRTGVGFPESHERIWFMRRNVVVPAERRPDGEIRTGPGPMRSRRLEARAGALDSLLADSLRGALERAADEAHRPLFEPALGSVACEVFIEGRVPVEWLLDAGVPRDQATAVVIYHYRAVP